VDGAVVADLETGREITVRARHVINATGVWTEDTEALAGDEGGLRVLASKGVHVVVPRDRIRGDVGLIVQTAVSVLFVIPWSRYWIIGTTDTPWDLDPTHPVATAADVGYVLDQANAVLSCELRREDVIGTYAGLRPLLQPGTKAGTSSAKVSREHTVASPAPGLTVIAGGKLTTYRVMAKDAVDFAIGDDAAARPSVTHDIPLLGAEGLRTARSDAAGWTRRYGWTPAMVDHLLHRYGASLFEIVALCEADPSLARPLEQAPAYLRAEVHYAVSHEGAIHLEDVLAHRTRLVYERPDGALAAVDEIAAVVAPLLGWDDATRAAEIESYTARVHAEAMAAAAPDDAAAAVARREASDVAPMRPLARSA
jgi:glycerol-3-phosphate dehydrogenase